MTNPTATSGGVGPFETPFQTGAAAVSAISFLLGLLFIWTGYQESELLVVGTELNIINGAAGFMLLGFLGVVALVAAFYMELGLSR